MKRESISSLLLIFAIACAAFAQIFPQYLDYSVAVALILCVVIFVDYVWRNRPAKILAEPSNLDVTEEIGAPTESIIQEWKEALPIGRTALLFDIELQYLNASKKVLKSRNSYADMDWTTAFPRVRREQKGAHHKRPQSRPRYEATNFDLCS